jgi:hypothetical protein
MRRRFGRSHAEGARRLCVLASSNSPRVLEVTMALLFAVAAGTTSASYYSVPSIGDTWRMKE